MGNNSDVNLRSHLANVHGRNDLLTAGQLKHRSKNDNIQITDQEEKKIVDEAVLKCIYEDSRPYNDFCKPGMTRLLKVLKPNYKPMSKQTVRKRHKIKYYLIKKNQIKK